MILNPSFRISTPSLHRLYTVSMPSIHPHADRVLVGACNLIPCPILFFRQRGNLHLDLPVSHEDRVKIPVYNRAVNLAADLQFTMTGEPTPKHVGVAMACRSVSVPNGVIDLLHGLGVSITADLARRIENGIAHDETMTHLAEIKRYLKKYGVDLVIDVTGDNCDHLVKGSPDGKQFSYLQIEIRLSLRGGGKIDYIPPPLEKVSITAPAPVRSPLGNFNYHPHCVLSL